MNAEYETAVRIALADLAEGASWREMILANDRIRRTQFGSWQVDVWNLRGQGALDERLKNFWPMGIRWMFAGPLLDSDGSSEGEVLMWLKLTAPDAVLFVRVPTRYRTSSPRAFLLFDDGGAMMVSINPEQIEPGLAAQADEITAMRGES